MIISDKCLLSIDLKIIKNNYHLLQKLASNAEVAAAVKANCYGLGVDNIAPILENSGCKHFFVANKDEGVHLRSILKKEASNIYVLSGYFPGDNALFIKNRLIPVLNSLANFKWWEKLAYDQGQKLPCVLHINTGMNRLGLQEQEVLQLQNNMLDILYIMSHLSSSEDPSNNISKNQLTKFKELSALFSESKKSLANSGGVFLGSDYHFDMVRPGGALYGLNLAPYLADSGIRNSVMLTAPIIQIARVHKGHSVGYNETHTADQDMLVATLPLGYADGYLRSLSNKGIVFINGNQAKVVGRISMDLITVDVTDIPQEDLFLGQRVEIIGQNISPDKLGTLAGTNGYEILTSLGKRYERVYT